MQSKIRRSLDANSPIPEGVTSQFIEKILSLRSSPKSEHLKREFLSKFVSDETDSPIVRRTRAINKWLATERHNEATNDRLLNTAEDYQLLPHVKWSSFVSRLQDVILAIVGDVPDDPFGGFSGGASTSRKRTASQPALKYLGKAHITASALPYWESLSSSELRSSGMDGWLSSNPIEIETVRGNVLFTVPKKTDIDRCACAEPDLNMFMQRALGASIRRDLRRRGIDLNDQSINRSLAYEGSRTGALATLDLSSASDSICTELVALAMPPVWFSTLNALRCDITIIDGHEHRNEMFSSMGNGFTFELESLLFYSIARTVAYFRGVSGVISVYGDDIICPSELFDDLVWCLRYLGFETNVDKSFATGSFRESCGGHYNGGLDVTPFYLRKPLKRIDDVIHMANSLRKWASYGLGILDPDCYPIWEWLASMVPKRLWGGRDTSFKYALVSACAPRDFLRPKVVTKRVDEGGYYHWLNATWRRDREGDIQTSSISTTVAFYRFRPNRVVNSPLELFLEEL